MTQLYSVEDRLKSITRKCEQYWNEPLPNVEEFHAILEFIEQETQHVAQGIQGLQHRVKRLEQAIELLGGPALRKLVNV